MARRRQPTAEQQASDRRLISSTAGIVFEVSRRYPQNGALEFAIDLLQKFVSSESGPLVAPKPRERKRRAEPQPEAAHHAV